MKIKVISVGKLKEEYIQNAIDYFKNQSSNIIEMIEVLDEKAPEILSEKQQEQVKDKEGIKIIQKIDKEDFVITLEIKGKMLSLEQFSKKLNQVKLMGYKQITFIIGGSLGLSKEVMKRSDFAISFSNMTFPHQLMRWILVEQITRALALS